MQNLMHCLFHDTHFLELFHIRFSHFQARRGSSQASYAWQFDVKSCLRIGLGRWYLDHHLPCYKNVHTKITRIDKLNISKFIEKVKIMGFISKRNFLVFMPEMDDWYIEVSSATTWNKIPDEAPGQYTLSCWNHIPWQDFWWSSIRSHQLENLHNEKDRSTFRQITNCVWNASSFLRKKVSYRQSPLLWLAFL